MVEKQMKIVDLKIEDLISNDVQPEGRTTDTALHDLFDRMKITGVCMPIAVSGNTILDGHRRAHVWAALGHDTVPCVILDVDKAAAFGHLNAASRAIGGSGWFFGWSQKGDKYLRVMPKHQAANIRDMVETIGRKRALELAAAGATPAYMIRVGAITAGLAAAFPNEAPTKAQVCEWIYGGKKRANLAYVALSEGSRGSLRRLLRAVKSGKDLQ